MKLSYSSLFYPKKKNEFGMKFQNLKAYLLIISILYKLHISYIHMHIYI